MSWHINAEKDEESRDQWRIRAAKKREMPSSVMHLRSYSWLVRRTLWSLITNSEKMAYASTCSLLSLLLANNIDCHLLEQQETRHPHNVEFLKVWRTGSHSDRMCLALSPPTKPQKRQDLVSSLVLILRNLTLVHSALHTERSIAEIIPGGNSVAQYIKFFMQVLVIRFKSHRSSKNSRRYQYAILARKTLKRLAAGNSRQRKLEYIILCLDT